MEYLIFASVMIVILTIQQIFWSRLCLQLTNRIMSRSYEELKQAEKMPLKIAPILPEDPHDPFADRQAKELNSMLGIA